MRRSGRLIAIAALGLALALPSRAAEVGVRAALVSDYVHRGLLQTDAGPALQGSLEYRAPAGWFFGSWASQVDYAYDRRDAEIDLYAGYGHRFSADLAVEAVVIHYDYAGGGDHRQDWNEVQLTAYLGDLWSFTLARADNWWEAGRITNLIEGGFRYPLPMALTLDATVGWQFSEPAVGFDYGYAEAGLSRTLGTIVMRLGYAASDGDARRHFGGLAEPRWLASLTWQR